MAGIPDHVIDQIRERTDLAELVGRYMTLRRAGQRLVGLCPFHSEKSPSFTVHPDKQFFHCFGCQAHGDVFAFRMRCETLDFPEAARALAREAGIQIPEGEGGANGQAEALRGLHQRAHAFFRERLRSADGAAARAYLEQRGTPADLVERFELGFAPAGWDGLVAELARLREPPEQAERAGLIASRQHSPGHYDRFRARLIFPICDSGGRVVAFGGRALGDEKPKYLNSTENPIYRKGRVLFGLHLALPAIRRRERAVLVEGYFDVIALHRAGVGEAVAPCGTALTREQIQMLHRYTREVVLLFDGDTAGRNAAERALPLLLAEGMRVRAAFLPAGEDPDTLLGRAGPDALRERVDQAVPYLDHRIDELVGMQRAHAWDAADRVRELAPYLHAISDAVEREAYVLRIASSLELSPAAVAQALRSAAPAAPAPRASEAGAALGPAAAQPREPGSSAAVPAPAPELRLDALLRTLFEALLARPQLVEVLDTGPPPFELSWVAEVSARELLAELLELLRAHRERASAAIFGPNGPAALAGALSGLAAAERFRSAAEAEAALRDCVRELELRALRRRLAQLRNGLESCSDVRQNEQLFAELASLHDRCGRLDRQHRAERERTRILSTSP